MKITTKGIVLRYFKYGDSGMIAHIYTKDYGCQSFIFKGINAKNKKRKIGFLQPLSLVEIPIDFRLQKELYFGNGAQSLYTFQTIPFSYIKSSSAFFLAEVLSKLLKIGEMEEVFFTFLCDSILFLDSENTKGGNYHLCFLVKLMEFMGIQPNLKENSLLEIQASLEQIAIWEKFQSLSFEQCDALSLSRRDRNDFLEKILSYYSFHLQDLSKLKTLDILKEVFQ